MVIKSKWWYSSNSKYFFFVFNFTILYWFCHISTWICLRYTRVCYINCYLYFFNPWGIRSMPCGFESMRVYLYAFLRLCLYRNHVFNRWISLHKLYITLIQSCMEQYRDRTDFLLRWAKYTQASQGCSTIPMIMINKI